MTTFGVMQARIADEMVRDDLTNQIRLAINEAIKQWEGQRFHFNERRYRINTVAGQEYYDLSAPVLLTSAGAPVVAGETVLELDDITCTVSNWPYRLCPRTQQWFNDMQSSTYQGQPCDYTIYGNQLRVFPIPDGVYPINLNALARLGPSPLANANDSNAWMTEGEPLIRNQAKMILYRDVLRDPTGQKNAAEGIVEAEWSLGRKMAGKAYTGRQKAWSL